MNNYDLEVLNVMVVDDNLYMHAIVREILYAMRVTKIHFCADAPDAFTELQKLCPDIIITDWALLPTSRSSS